MPDLELTFASGESSLSVRRFSVHEAFSAPFQVDVWARSPEQSLDLEALCGKAASLRVTHGFSNVGGKARVWSGVVSYAEQARPEPSAKGLSTYRFTIVPRLWLLGHRTNYRVYQHVSIPAIVEKLLKEWDIHPVFRIDRGRYPELEYKAQYDETDLHFVHRLLEEAGITLFFDDAEGEAKMVLADRPQEGERRDGPPIPYVDNPNQAAEREFVTEVHLSNEVRHGTATIRDVDFRRPAFGLRGEAKRQGAEAPYEHYDYRPGAFLVEPRKGGDTPVADDRGVARHDDTFGNERAERALLAERAGKQAITLGTNVLDLKPGTVFSTSGHTHPGVDGKKLLVTGLVIQGAQGEEWRMTVHAVSGDVPWVPPASTPRPAVIGVQTATVVGPRKQNPTGYDEPSEGIDAKREEIHTDEFGRVRVQFPWDREGKNDEQSGAWIRVNEGWGGRGYGFFTLPRVGQEVLVAFLEGDPDRPLVVGRVFNQTQPVTVKLPENKTQSDYISNSSPGSAGFNEIKYEDKAGDELVYWQAEKNERKLVKNDETITVGHDRRKDVANDETDTTDHDRFEVTRHDRTERTSNDRMTFIKKDRRKLVKNDEREQTLKDRLLRVGKDEDLVIGADRRELIYKTSHLHVQGDRREKIGETQSLTIGEDQFEDVKGSHALKAGGEIHLSSVETLIGEARDATIKGPGGFIRIDGSGIRIVGKIVDINVGGTAGDGQGSRPELPHEAEQTKIEDGTTSV